MPKQDQFVHVILLFKNILIYGQSYIIAYEDEEVVSYVDINIQTETLQESAENAIQIQVYIIDLKIEK